MSECSQWLIHKIQRRDAAHVAQGNPALRVPQPEAWLVANEKQALALTAHVLGGEENSHCVGDIKRRTR